MAPFCRLVLCHCSSAGVEEFGVLLVPPVPAGRRRQVVLAMVIMDIRGIMWWEMEQQRPGSSHCCGSHGCSSCLAEL